MLDENYIEIGKIVRTHGIRGDLSAIFYSTSESDVKKYKNFYLKNGQEVFITFKSKFQTLLREDLSTHQLKTIISVNKIGYIERAKPLVNQGLYVKKESVETNDEEFLISDLINLKIHDWNEKDKHIGHVKDVRDFGGGTIIEIESNLPEYAAFSMFHFDNMHFPEINITEKIIYLNSNFDLIEELEDDDEEIELDEELNQKLLDRLK
jgi:16S rRNA processing protein RimM